MSTISDNNVSAALFGKARRAVLSLLYSHSDEALYLRELARATGVGLGAVQREVRRLSEVGIIRRMVRGRQVYYQANPECPVFEELKSLVVKTAGVAEVLRAALTPLADRVAVAFVCGSMASGKERRGSDVDILVIGDVTFSETVQALGRTQETLRREINPTVYPSREFRSKLRKGHHFLKAVLEEEKIFLIGNVRELARLVGKRLAD